MATHTPGNGASVTGVSFSDSSSPPSFERYVYGLLALLESEENTLIRLRPNTLDLISISNNLSTKKATIQLLLNCDISYQPTGEINISTTHYLSGSTFASGTGGDFTAPNLPQAIISALVKLKSLEGDVSKNPQNISTTQITISQSPDPGKASFTAQITLPIDILQLPGGGSVIEGGTYLS